MAKANTNIIPFPIIASDNLLGGQAPLSLRTCLESQALDLAVATEVLSVRVTKAAQEPLTTFVIHKYKRNLAAVRTILNRVQNLLDQLELESPAS